MYQKVNLYKNNDVFNIIYPIQQKFRFYYPWTLNKLVQYSIGITYKTKLQDQVCEKKLTNK